MSHRKEKKISLRRRRPTPVRRMWHKSIENWMEHYCHVNKDSFSYSKVIVHRRIFFRSLRRTRLKWNEPLVQMEIFCFSFQRFQSSIERTERIFFQHWRRSSRTHSQASQFIRRCREEMHSFLKRKAKCLRTIDLYWCRCSTELMGTFETCGTIDFNW